MKTKQFTVTPYWDSRVQDEKGVSRVLLTINLNRQQFRVSIKVKCTQAEFKSAMNTRSANARELRKVLHDYVSKAEMILDKLNTPTKDSFLRLFKSDVSLSVNDKTSTVVVFTAKIDELKKDGRLGTANNYRDALRSFQRYRKDLYFEDIDEKWLKGYLAFVVDNGNSVTTAQIYLRCLRAIFNDAIKQGFISEKCYPFKNFNSGTTVKTKSVLYPNQVKQLWDYQPKGIREDRARAYWFFLYLCNGMNFKDMCYLRWKNIKGDTLTFVRQKTKRTTKSGTKEIQVHLHDEAKRIIKIWGNKDKSPDAFIFPILSKSKTAEHMQKTGFRYKRVCNKMLANIGKQLGFDIHLCLNIARHSFATMLKIAGTPTSFIGDAMGHTSSKTTEHYLKSLPSEQLKQMSEVLLKF